jgi:hypothetical protein
MKATTVATILAVVFGICTVVLTGAASLLYLQYHAGDRLLEKMAMIQPGQTIAEVELKLGKPMRKEDTLEGVADFSRFKDKAFCRGKKLYWFGYTTPPCRVIEVYTDTNDMVVFVAWRGL